MIIHRMFTKNKKCFGDKRKLKDIKYIAIHYTGNKGDTAKGNCNYFKNGNLSRNAGAHFFVDTKQFWQSIPMTRVANSVGAVSANKTDGGGSYYGKCTNANSISIEWCDCLKGASAKQIELTKKLLKKIKRKCKNAKTIVRHWDVTGKECPAPYVGKNNKKWKEIKSELSEVLK